MTPSAGEMVPQCSDVSTSAWMSQWTWSPLTGSPLASISVIVAFVVAAPSAGSFVSLRLTVA